jgi:prolyl oligopeptidase
MAKSHWSPNQYPQARRCDHKDTFKSTSQGSVTVPDPYRWLEEYSEETDKWTSAQEAFTRSHISKYPLRQRLEDAFFASQDYARVSYRRISCHSILDR